MKKVLALVLCAMLMLASVSALAESSDKVHLEFFNIKPEVVDILNTLIDKFEAENPDIDVEQTQVPRLHHGAADPCGYQQAARNADLLRH